MRNKNKYHVLREVLWQERTWKAMAETLKNMVFQNNHCIIQNSRKEEKEELFSHILSFREDVL